MPDSTAKSGFNTRLKRATVQIAEVVSITGPTLSRNPIDVTYMQSADGSATTPDGWREFIGGLADGGEVTFELNFLPGLAGHKTLITDLTGVKQSFSIEWAGTAADIWTFNALVIGFEPSAQIDDKLSASVTMKVTEKPTFPA